MRSVRKKKKMSNSNYEQWTYEEELLLAKTRVEFNHLFTGRKGNVKKGWEKVIKTLAQHGDQRSNESKIMKKWGLLGTWYKNKKDPSRRDTGRGTEDGNVLDTADNELFNVLHDFYTPKHNMNPPLLADSSMTENIRSADSDEATGRSSYLGLDSSNIKGRVPEEYLCQPSTSTWKLW